MCTYVHVLAGDDLPELYEGTGFQVRTGIRSLYIAWIVSELFPFHPLLFLILHVSDIAWSCLSMFCIVFTLVDGRNNIMHCYWIYVSCLDLISLPTSPCVCSRCRTGFICAFTITLCLIFIDAFPLLLFLLLRHLLVFDLNIVQNCTAFSYSTSVTHSLS